MKKEMKNKNKKSNYKSIFKNVLFLRIVAFILFVAFIFLIVQNLSLKKEMKIVRNDFDTFSLNAVNDFSLFVMSKVSNCEGVTLVADDKSITINDVNCK